MQSNNRLWFLEQELNFDSVLENPNRFVVIGYDLTAIINNKQMTSKDMKSFVAFLAYSAINLYGVKKQIQA